MFTRDQLEVVSSLIAVVLNNDEALLHFNDEQLNDLHNEVQANKYRLLTFPHLEVKSDADAESDVVLVCQDCGEAFDALDAASAHACRENFTEDEAADQWRTSIRAVQF